jgi:hypothetical protein
VIWPKSNWVIVGDSKTLLAVVWRSVGAWPALAGEHDRLMSSSNLSKQLDAVLWDHQKEAIGFALNRLRRPHPRNAALIFSLAINASRSGSGYRGRLAVA